MKLLKMRNPMYMAKPIERRCPRCDNQEDFREYTGFKTIMGKRVKTVTVRCARCNARLNPLVEWNPPYPAWQENT